MATFNVSKMSSRETKEMGILIERFRQGEMQAFEELILMFQKPVFAVALGILGNMDEAEEITQDTFVQIHKSIQSFRGESKFSTWLFGILINLCRRRRYWWAQRKRHIVSSLDDPEKQKEGRFIQKMADKEPSAADQLMQRELREQLLSSLGELDEMSRTMVVLRDIRELSYGEIAQITRCRLGTVKSRLSRARHQLKEIWQRDLKNEWR